MSFRSRIFLGMFLSRNYLTDVAHDNKLARIYMIWLIFWARYQAILQGVIVLGKDNYCAYCTG